MIYKKLVQNDSVICVAWTDESVPGPVLMNGDETCHVSCSRWW